MYMKTSKVGTYLGLEVSTTTNFENLNRAMYRIEISTPIMMLSSRSNNVEG